MIWQSTLGISPGKIRDSVVSENGGPQWKVQFRGIVIINPGSSWPCLQVPSKWSIAYHLATFSGLFDPVTDRNFMHCGTPKTIHHPQFAEGPIAWYHCITYPIWMLVAHEFHYLSTMLLYNICAIVVKISLHFRHDWLFSFCSLIPEWGNRLALLKQTEQT